MCEVYGKKMTECEMYQLLGLAEDRIERLDRYHRTEVEAHRRPIEEREEPDHECYIWIGDVGDYPNGPMPNDLAFWQTVYDEVMQELIDSI